jgi:hypothetical protein
MAVVQRVVECYALRRDDDGYTFKTPKTFFAFLARKVLRLKRDGLLANSNAWQLAHVGGIIDGALGKFATAALMRMDKDQAEHDTFNASCEVLVKS